jgi:UDP-N-acetyl-D-mannosaminuronate dehydrogenase
MESNRKDMSQNEKKDDQNHSCFVCYSQLKVNEGIIRNKKQYFHPKCWNEFKNTRKIFTDLQDGIKKVLVIGLGEIGYSNAEYMTGLGIWVDGFDIKKEAISKAIKNEVIKKEAENFSGYDYYLICVSTHKLENMNVPDLSGIYQVVFKILKEGKNGSLLGIDSTIPLGTTKKINEILNHKLHVVHVPHRFYKYEKDQHGVNQKRVIGACQNCCYDKGRQFYSQILEIPLQPVDEPEIAELTKIVENSYRYVEIAFAEEMRILCDKLNLNFEHLRSAINTKWNINMLKAIKGIGGHCLPKDSQMVLDISKQNLSCSIIDTAKQIDEEYRLHIQQSFKQVAST